MKKPYWVASPTSLLAQVEKSNINMLQRSKKEKEDLSAKAVHFSVLKSWALPLPPQRLLPGEVRDVSSSAQNVCA